MFSTSCSRPSWPTGSSHSSAPSGAASRTGTGCHKWSPLDGHGHPHGELFRDPGHRQVGHGGGHHHPPDRRRPHCRRLEPELSAGAHAAARRRPRTRLTAVPSRNRVARSASCPRRGQYLLGGAAEVLARLRDERIELRASRADFESTVVTFQWVAFDRPEPPALSGASWRRSALPRCCRPQPLRGCRGRTAPKSPRCRLCRATPT